MLGNGDDMVEHVESPECDGALFRTSTHSSLSPPFPLFCCGHWILWYDDDTHQLIIERHSSRTTRAHDEDNDDGSDRTPSPPMSMGRDSEEQRQRHDTTIHGLALDVYARATIGMSSIFLGPALLSLANAAAGCSNSDDRDATNSDTDGTTTECTATVYGFRPSSLLTNIAAVSGVLGCIALPYFGSIIDRTPYRRHVGYGTAIGLTLLKAVETLLITSSL
jgi:hypothetical protein